MLVISAYSAVPTDLGVFKGRLECRMSDETDSATGMLQECRELLLTLWERVVWGAFYTGARLVGLAQRLASLQNVPHMACSLVQL